MVRMGWFLSMQQSDDKEASQTRVYVAQKARHFARLAQVPRFAKSACSE
jgi:hypothetical protein